MVPGLLIHENAVKGHFLFGSTDEDQVGPCHNLDVRSHVMPVPYEKVNMSEMLS